MKPLYRRYKEVLKKKNENIQKLSSMVNEEQVLKNFEDYYPSFRPQTLNQSKSHRSFSQILTDMDQWKQKQEM